METTSKKEVPQRVIGAMADAFGKSLQTMKRWFDNKDIRLTTDRAKEVFARENFNWEELESNRMTA